MILILENSKGVAIILEQLINKALNVKTAVASTLAQAEEVIKQHPEEVSLAVMSLNLPDATGPQIVKSIAGKNISSIIFTTNDDRKMRENLMINNVIDYVIKEDNSSFYYLISLIKRFLKNASTKVLIVDDSRATRRYIKTLLSGHKLTIFNAPDGSSALQTLYDEPDIKLVLTDYHMPGMDGRQLVKTIRANHSMDSLAIIGISSQNDSAIASQFIKAGANDFIHKPFSSEELFCRVMQNLDSIDNVKQIKKQKQVLDDERIFIEDIITRMRTTKSYDPKHINTLITSVEATSGDAVFAAFTPDGAQHIALGDFTGHGLPAAISGPMASDIFYSMTKKGLDGSEIISEINLKLYKRTPVSVFMALGFLQLDRSRRRLTIWNCSLPDILVYRGGKLIERIPSTHFARGAVNLPDEPGIEVDVEPGDRVYVYTDGFIEEQDRDGEMFGAENFENLLGQMLTGNESLEMLKRALHAYRSGEIQSDDMTIIELTC